MTKTIEIKTTKITTWRLQVETMYSVLVITDGEYSWSQNFDNALDAVNCYNKFVDHGTCLNERVVTLVEPTGKLHTKTFRYPVVTAIH